MNATQTSNTDDTDWLLNEDQDGSGQADSAASAAPWRVLIVDDDVDVHVVTKFSLNNASFLGRRLSYLHAYSAAEALAIVRETPDIALILLDVIMESNDAGLQLTRQIREELGNQLVRIVLRTGQPGQALEHSIILDYDINDFWCKTDLTTRKLFTTVIASLRSYASLIDAERRIEALSADLDKALGAAAPVADNGGDALLHSTPALTLGADGHIADANPPACARLGYSRDALLKLGLEQLVEASTAAAILRKLDAGQAWSGDLALRHSDGAPLPQRAFIAPWSDAGAAQRRALVLLADGDN